jgi:hypothetical protein
MDRRRYQTAGFPSTIHLTTVFTLVKASSYSRPHQPQTNSYTPWKVTILVCRCALNSIIPAGGTCAQDYH